MHSFEDEVKRNRRELDIEFFVRSLLLASDSAIQALGHRLLHCIACNTSEEGQQRRCDSGAGSGSPHCRFNAEMPQDLPSHFA